MQATGRVLAQSRVFAPLSRGLAVASGEVDGPGVDVDVEATAVPFAGAVIADVASSYALLPLRTSP